MWYQLGTPAEGYQEFLRSESCWLMGSWRIAHFLHAAPKSTFNEVVHAPPQAFFLHHPCLAAALRLLPSPVPNASVLSPARVPPGL